MKKEQSQQIPIIEHISVKDLKLDLANFRTIKQIDEFHAVQAMISISPDYFWGLMDSLIDSGYLPIDNILVQRTGKMQQDMIVKDGNRRIAALKLIHGFLPREGIDIPANISESLVNLTNNWKKLNEKVPCIIYENKDTRIVDRIVTLAHGKAEKAGRDQWKAVARARHNRDVNKNSEPALDILEKFLYHTRELTDQQKERYSGDYPLTVLEEVMKRISSRFNVNNSPELAKQYPLIQYRKALDDIIKDIGTNTIRFENVRNKEDDFAVKYGLPPVPKAVNPSTSKETTPNTSSINDVGSSYSPGTQNRIKNNSPREQKAADNTQNAKSVNLSKKPVAVALDDPRIVKRLLRNFIPRGLNREKVVTLRDEALHLKLSDNPIAFCFLLRSMFEISAKAFCEDHKASGGPSCIKSDGKDRVLVEILRDIVNYLTKQNTDKEMLKKIHGAIVDLEKPASILSVTSMNQLVHNPSFSVSANDISRLFANIFPLLEIMNQ